MVHKNKTMRFLSSLINKGMWFLPLSSHQTGFPCTLNGEFSHPTKGSSSLADILRYHLATKKKSTFLISMFPFWYVESSKRKMGEDLLASKISWNKSNGATTSKRFFFFSLFLYIERTHLILWQGKMTGNYPAQPPPSTMPPQLKTLTRVYSWGFSVDLSPTLIYVHKVFGRDQIYSISLLRYRFLAIQTKMSQDKRTKASHQYS